jgi:glycerol-3-phosphate dehydrogenase
LDARSALEASPFVAKIMADELKKDKTWIQEQETMFKKVAESYVIDHYYEMPIN